MSLKFKVKSLKLILILVTGLWLLVSFLLGCTVRTYKITKERVDLKLEGNRGYLKGEPSPVKKEPKKTREISILEIEIGGPVKIE